MFLILLVTNAIRMLAIFASHIITLLKFSLNCYSRSELPMLGIQFFFFACCNLYLKWSHCKILMPYLILLQYCLCRYSSLSWFFYFYVITVIACWIKGVKIFSLQLSMLYLDAPFRVCGGTGLSIMLWPTRLVFLNVEKQKDFLQAV